MFVFEAVMFRGFKLLFINKLDIFLFFFFNHELNLFIISLDNSDTQDLVLTIYLQ